MATAWQRKFGDASSSCQTEVRKKVKDGQSLGGKSLLKAIGDCVRGKLKGKGKKGGGKRRKSHRKKHRKTRRARR